MQRLEKENISFLKFIVQPKPILDFFRAFIYIGFSVLFYFSPHFLNTFPLYKYLFCGGAFLYGVYRIYRIYSEYKNISR